MMQREGGSKRESPPGGKPARPARGRLDPGRLHVRVLDALLRVPETAGVKPGILRRTAQRVAAAILRSPISSTDPVHFRTLDLLYRLETSDEPLAGEAVLAVGRYLIRGRVVPPQDVQRALGEARRVYLARCPCRASGRVRDRELRPAGRGDPEALLAAVLEAAARPDVRHDTASRLLALLDETAEARAAGRPDGTLAGLFDRTWPMWEILLDHPDFDRAWLQGLAHNRKVWHVALPLARAWVDALALGRGVVFTHMEAAGLPYAVCSCPGPETDGGCMLTNWYYAGGDDEILRPNETTEAARRRDAEGRVLPCREHPERAGRPCLGCGCDHAEREALASRKDGQDDAGP